MENGGKEENSNEIYIHGDDSIIGVPIGLYLPDLKTAIEFYKPHGNKGIYYTEEWVKNGLCRRNHITMIRIEADIDIIRDIFKIEGIWEAQNLARLLGNSCINKQTVISLT